MDPTTGVVTVADGSRLDYESQTNHSIVIRATSTDGSESIRSLSLDVLPVNERPIATGESYQTDFVTPVGIPVSQLLANDIDPEGDVLTVKLVALPNSGKLILQENRPWVYTPEPNFSGVVTIVYVVSDGFLYSDPQTLQILVVPPSTTIVAPPENRDSPAVASDPAPAATVIKQPDSGPAAATPLLAPPPIENFNSKSEMATADEESVQISSELPRPRTKLDVSSKTHSGESIQDHRMLIARELTNAPGVHRLQLDLNPRSGIQLEQVVTRQFVPLESRESLDDKKQEFVYQTAAPVVVGTMIGVGVSLHVLASAQIGSTFLSQSGIFMPLDPMTVLEGTSKVKKSKEREDLLFDVTSIKNVNAS
jgi:hypothetical protein